MLDIGGALEGSLVRWTGQRRSLECAEQTREGGPRFRNRRNCQGLAGAAEKASAFPLPMLQFLFRDPALSTSEQNAIIMQSTNDAPLSGRWKNEGGKALFLLAYDVFFLIDRTPVQTSLLWILL